LDQAKHQYPANRILTFDETCWKRYFRPDKVFAEKRSGAVKLKTVKSEKEGYTSSGCISAAGEKLPFWFLAKGKTDTCHPKFKAPDDVIVVHTESGWTNEEMMLQDFPWLSNQAHGNRFSLSWKWIA
jgi:hypothetical protein